MVGWEKCLIFEDCLCWFVNKKIGERFDINSDYENYYLIGKICEYFIIVDKLNIIVDGYIFYGVIVFNEIYLGFWI